MTAEQIDCVAHSNANWFQFESKNTDLIELLERDDLSKSVLKQIIQKASEGNI